jgi:hypothetical protein
MRLYRLVPVLLVAPSSFVLAVQPSRAADTAAKPKAPVLTGVVTGPDGKTLEGVVVTAGRPGSNITVSVVSQTEGRYSFPAGKLALGRYFLTIRAAGYELDGDGAAQAGGKNAVADLAQINMVTTKSDVSGKVWTNNVGHGDIYRLDLKTGTYEHFAPYKGLPDDSPLAHRPHAIYGLASDSHDNLYFTDFVGR